LAGKWLLTSRLGAGPYVVTFVQTGNKLRADFRADVQCGDTGIRMFLTLEGEVHGREVWLRPTKGEIVSGRIDSELADRCSEYQVLRNSADSGGKSLPMVGRLWGPTITPATPVMYGGLGGNG
jgi:hypothetical protein